MVLDGMFKDVTALQKWNTFYRNAIIRVRNMTGQKDNESIELRELLGIHNRPHSSLGKTIATAAHYSPKLKQDLNRQGPKARS